MANNKKRGERREHAFSTSSKSEWLAHIRSLGLDSVDEYERWCRKHGFAFNRKKTWRQEREERTVAAVERKEAEAMQHVRQLGLDSIDAYFAWCRQNGYRLTLEKKLRQRQREIQRAQSIAVAPPQSPLATVTIEHIRALGLESVEEYRVWCLQNGLDEALAKKAEQLKKESAIATLALAKKQGS